MGKLKRENALHAKLKFEDVTIPDWPDDHGEPSEARVVQLPAGQLIAMMEFTKLPENKEDGIFHIVQRCLRDRDTNEVILLPEDIQTFREEGNFAVYQWLQTIALKLNKLNQGATDEIKKVLREAAIDVLPTALRDNLAKSTSIEKS